MTQPGKRYNLLPRDKEFMLNAIACGALTSSHPDRLLSR